MGGKDALKRLRQIGTKRECIKQFSLCLLNIKDVSECDKLYMFMTGLQPPVKMELKSQKV